MNMGVPLRSFTSGRYVRHCANAPAASLASLSPVAAFGVAPIANASALKYQPAVNKEELYLSGNSAAFKRSCLTLTVKL